MKKGHRRIVLKHHFVTQWQERVAPDSPGKIKNRLRSAMMNRPIIGIPGGFAVRVDGCAAICVIDGTLSWVFLTILLPGMKLKSEEEVG